ncbi:hypothetical protein B0T14DRAFT_521557 [Immersiella caudata]|uniref:NACHT domain-containing protein n=1 Tax=Immersiella caudata TaxID=314043 RepID=A0AA40C0S6_9PEZI|nr:hypothetical protein B0T14DRAFT_521557 [Immersiella caudata]
MESSFTIVCGVVQLVEFGIKVLTNIREIGNTADGLNGMNNTTLGLTRRFKKEMEGQIRMAKTHKMELEQYYCNRQGVGPDLEGALKRAINEAEALEGVLVELQPKRKGGFFVLFAAVKSIWKRKAVNEMEVRLRDLQMELVQKHLVVILQKIDVSRARQADQFDRACKQIESLVSQVVNSKSGPGTFAKEAAEALRDRELACVQSLSYSIMEEREAGISDPELETYNWIFRESPGGISTGFKEWLAQSGGIYWITGKPGSGKSTLTKHVARHNTTVKYLKVWAKEKKLIVADFFFWRSGAMLQRSLEGLLRSVLYQVLHECRELVPDVLKEALSSVRSEWSCFWTLDRLDRAWKSLISVSRASEAKICLFIDGLDEYEGGGGGQSGDMNITNRFKELVDHPTIKVCLSSRLHAAFSDAFGQVPHLRMQDFTKNDIRLYIKNRLSSNNDKQATALRKEIAEKAEGVFLWVRLVVASCVEGQVNGDSFETLRNRVSTTPEDLEELFRQILGQIGGKDVPREVPKKESAVEECYRKQCFRLLCWAKRAQEAGDALTLTDLYFAELGFEVNERKLSPVFMPLSQFSRDFATSLPGECQNLQRRIMSRCKGLLEVHENESQSPESWHVGFLHRSVADFLDAFHADRNRDWPSKAEVGSAGLRVRILKLKHLAGLKEIKRKDWFDTFRPEICNFIEVCWEHKEAGILVEQCVRLLDELRLTADEVWSTVKNRSSSEEEGKTHWSAAARMSLITKHPGSVDKDRRWDVAPELKPLPCPTFWAFVQDALLDLDGPESMGDEGTLSSEVDGSSEGESVEDGEWCNKADADDDDGGYDGGTEDEGSEYEGWGEVEGEETNGWSCVVM